MSMGNDPWAEFRSKNTAVDPWSEFRSKSAQPAEQGVGDWEVEGKDYFVSPLTGEISRPNNSPSKSLPEIASGMVEGVKNASISGMAKGLYESGKSAATLPGDVYSGKVDPYSNEGIERSLNLATFSTPGSSANTGALKQPLALSRQELKNAASQGYNKLDELGGQIDPQLMSSTASDIKSELTKEGYRKSNVPKTFKAVKELNSPTGETSVIEQALADPLEASLRDKWGVPLEGKTQTTGNLSDLTSVRKVLGKARMDYTESDAARRAVGHIDRLIEKVSPEASGVLKNADADYAGSMRAKRIDKISEVADRASRNGANYDASARNRVTSLLNNEKKSIGFSAAEKSQLEKIGSGTAVNKISRLLGRLAPTGINPIPYIASAAGYATLGPAFAAVPPAIGIAGKLIANASTRRQLGKMNELSRSLAPSSKVQSMRRLNPTGNAIVDALMGAR